MDVLARIRQLVRANRYRFSEKALDEMEVDDLNGEDIVESINGAAGIAKRPRSSSALCASS